MIGRAVFSSKYWRVLRWAGLAAAAPALWACTSRTLEPPNVTPTATVTTNFTQKINNELDILFMIDNSSSMKEMQAKLYDQLPLFMNKLTGLPNPPSLHVAVVSSDMGAPGDSTSAIMCTQSGDSGQFQSAERGMCGATTLTAGATFISDADMMPNYTDPIANVFQCIALLGDTGCGFENQLGSIDRALGGDGQQPITNANFLRPEAYLGIVILTNEDDCSIPAGSPLYSLHGGQQNAANPLGPIANYRCNQFGHICTDPGSGSVGEPPAQPPGDAMMTGTTPTLTLKDCMSDDSGGANNLVPVSKFINDIKKLKTDPDNQILVAAISAPAAPYTVAWLPASGGTNTQPGEVWPVIEHSCGAKNGMDVNPDPTTQNSTDGSFGDPGVRIAQFVNAFPNSVLASICDPSYASSMQAIATKLGQLITPPCITGLIQNDTQGQPMCSVVEHLIDMSNNKKDVPVQNCDENGDAPPCWRLIDGGTNCSGKQMMVTDPPGTNNSSENSTVNCSLCLPGAAVSGCPCIAGNMVAGCLP